MESHHHQTVAFAGILIENNGQLGKPCTVELAEIDNTFFMPTLQVLERRYAPIAFNHEESSCVGTLNHDGIDVEPTVCLDTCDKVSNIFLLASKHDVGRAPLHIGVEYALPRDRPVLGMVYEPKVVRIKV